MTNRRKDTMAKALNAIHKGVLSASGGRLGSEIGGQPVVELTTTGRKSGNPRSVMLTTPTTHDGDMVLVAAYGGDDRHPAWYLNLQANPAVSVKHLGETWRGTARTADAAERASLWPQITGTDSVDAGGPSRAAQDRRRRYQDKTNREIPVVIISKR